MIGASVGSSTAPGFVYDLHAFASDDIYGVGSNIILHWDGSDWSIVEDDTTLGDFFLVMTDAVGPCHLIAIVNKAGQYKISENGEITTLPLFLHWNGSSWTQVSAPGFVYDLHAFASDDIYGVGSNIILHWDGSDWSIVEDDTTLGDFFLVMTDAVGPCHLIAIGTPLAWLNPSTLPGDFNAFRGFYNSGDLDSLLESDDDKLCYNPGIVLDPTEAPITLDFLGTLPNDSPATLDVTIESSANTVGLEITISYWNYNTNSWDVVGTDTQSLNADTVRTFAGNPADHVELGTGEVRTRYEVRVVSFIFIFPWTDCVDHVFWMTTD